MSLFSFLDRENQAEASNGVKLFLAWSFVGIPLVLGVYNTLLNAMKLFGLHPVPKTPS